MDRERLRIETVFEKARQLSVLCESEIAVIILSSTGDMFEYASSSMNQVLSRFSKSQKTSENSIVDPGAEVKTSDKVAVPKKENAQLKQKIKLLLGNNLNGLGSDELQQLEQLLNQGLLSAKDRKEQLLMYEIEQSRMKVKHFALENAKLQKQIEELQSYLPRRAQPESSYLEYSQEMTRFPETNGASSPDRVCKIGAEDVDLLPTLQLGNPSHGQRKRKEPEQETVEKESRYGTSESQIEM